MTSRPTPPPRFDEETPDFPADPRDTFDAPVLKSCGFCDRTVSIAHQFNGQAPVSHGSFPLEVAPDLKDGDLFALHAALTDDPQACLYAAARHRHMGVAVLTVSATVGIRDQQHEADFELTDPDGYLRFAVGSTTEVSPALQRAGRKEMQWIAQMALDGLVHKYKDN
jgi:hypothetical protein